MASPLRHRDRFRVGVDLLVIPDGVRVADGKPCLRISLAVTPHVRTGGPEPTAYVDLRNWPTEIAKLTKTLRVWRGRIRGHFESPEDMRTIVDSEILGTVASDVATEAAQFAPRATALWHKMFTGGSLTLDEGFERLLAALSAKAVGPQPNSSGADQQLFGTYQTGYLANALDIIYASSLAQAILQRLGSPRAVSLGQMSSFQSEQGSSRESMELGVRWWKMMHDRWLGTSAANDPASALADSTNFESERMLHPAYAAYRSVRAEMMRAARVFRGEPDVRAAHAGALELVERAVRTLSDLEQLKRHFMSKIGDVAFWRDGIDTTLREGDSGPNRTLRKEFTRFSECWGISKSPFQEKPTKDTYKEEIEAAGRKYVAIHSYPTLAKYLGLIVDVEIEQSSLVGATPTSRIFGAIAVDAPPPAGVAGSSDSVPLAGQLSWTAFVLRPPTTGAGAYFGPCDRYATGDAKPYEDSEHGIVDGLLNLSSKLTPNGPRRFELHTVDVTNGVNSLEQKGARIKEADRRGLLRSEQSTRLPELLTRGIALVDHAREHSEVENTERDAQQDFYISDASDLLLGYRVDVALSRKDGHWQSPGRWRSLVARDVTYGPRDIDPDVDPGFLALEQVIRARTRDDGHARWMTKTDKVPTSAGFEEHVVPNPELFTWPGESLAVSSMHQSTGGTSDCRTVWPNPRLDLAIDLRIDLPRAPRLGEPDRRPLPLREGRGYLVGARVCFVNGCGVDLSDALPQYIKPNNIFALGSEPGIPFVYKRRHDIQAPDVLLPWDDRIVHATSSVETPGENIDHLVVRSGAIQTRSARRYVVPPRTTFDLAEQHGVFDADESAQPSGAFVGSVRAILDPNNGTFPVARAGSIGFAPSEVTAAGESRDAKETSRGSVLVLDHQAPRPISQFYPDPMARMVHARFVVGPNSGFEPSRHAVEFWAPGLPPAEAKPIMLELRRGGRGESRYRGWFNTKSTKVDVRPRNAPALFYYYRLNKLEIALAPAETVDLELWSAPDIERLVKTHHLLAYAIELAAAREEAGSVSQFATRSIVNTSIARFNALVQWSPSKNAWLAIAEALMNLGATPQINTRKIVRLIHAVDRPLPPTFVISKGGQVAFQPVAVTVGGERQRDNLSSTWQHYIDLHQSADPLTWPSEENGSTVFFVGEISVDRPSSVKVRCEAQWLNYGPDTIRFDSQRGWLVDPPINYAQLFTIDAIRTDDLHRNTTVDLLYDDETNEPRSLSHSFTDGKARYLTLQLIATSRFTEFFPPEPESRPRTRRDRRRDSRMTIGRYESASTENLEQRSTQVWIPCTFRPPVPEIDRVLPHFRTTTETRKYGNEITWKRDSALRIFMKNTDGDAVSPTPTDGSIVRRVKSSWHASGEDEMLAVIFWPIDITKPQDICSFEEQTQRFNKYITRWGGDPIHLSGRMTDLLSPDQFSDYSRFVPEVLLTLAEPDKEPMYSLGAVERAPYPNVRRMRRSNSAQMDSLAVSAFIYEPHLDPTDGTWYFDVTVDPRASYFPFLQLGLARYQPHCVAGLELSPPVTAWAQIPPRREGRVVFRDLHHVVLEVHGFGYRRSNLGKQHEDQKDLGDHPLLNVRLMEVARLGNVADEGDGRISWRPVVDASGQFVELLRLRPVQRGRELWWICDITLPTSHKHFHYGLLVEEIEVMAADRLATESADITCSGPRFTTNLEERGPMFGHMIDLRK